jgi:sugar lactone lactonase YvrE
VGGNFSGPCGTAVDKAGNVYVADYGNSEIFEIVAVNGSVTASSTVNQIAASFSFSSPCDVKLDASGNLFVADSGTGNVYKIAATNGAVSVSSEVTTIAGGFSYASGLAFDPSGNLYVADYSGAAVYEIPATKGLIVAGTTPVALPTPTGGWTSPWSVATDASGDVFVTDYSRASVFEIVAVSGSVVATSAVNAVGSGFANPTGIAVDGQGNVFVTDNGAGTLKVISQSGGTVSASSEVMTLVSGLSISDGPYGLSLDGNGNIYVADYDQHAVYEVSMRSLNMGTVAVGSRSSVFPMKFTAAPGGVLTGWSVLNGVEGGSAFADAGGDTCVKGKTYTQGQNCIINVRFMPTLAGTYSGMLTLTGSDGLPFLWVNLTGIGSAPQISYLPGTTSAPLVANGLDYPDSTAVDGSGNVYVADPDYNSICKLPVGSTVCTWIGKFKTPEGMAVDGSGNIFVVDYGGSSNAPAVYELTPFNGSYSQRTLSTNFDFPTGIALDGSGNIYVADDGAGAIVKLSSYYNNEFWQTTIASGLQDPWAVAVDGSGNIYVAGNNEDTSSTGAQVYKLTPYSTGYALSTLGSGWVDPNGIAVDAAGDVYVADDDWGNGNGFVAELAPTVSGGVTTYTQSTLIPSTQLASPEGVTVDSKGNLYVVDGLTGTSNAYKFDYADAPSLNFANTTVGQTSSDSPHDVTVNNIGNLPLNLAAVNYPNFFPWSGMGAPPCVTGLTLDPGQGCTVDVNFQPTWPGSYSYKVLLTDNVLNAVSATQRISVNGTGVALTTATLTSPTLGASLAATGQTFNWAPAIGATGYTLYLGSTGVGSGNLLDVQTNGTSITTGNLPINGETIYVRLWTNFNGVWMHNDYTFSAAAPAALTSPTGTTIAAAGQTFTWAPVGGVTGYTLFLGSQGTGSGNLVDDHTTSTSFTSGKLPKGTINARLWTNFNGVWRYNDYTFTAQ